MSGLHQREDDNTNCRRGSPHHGTQRPFLSPACGPSGPLPTSKHGENYIFTVIDRSTRWAEAIPLPSTTTDSCATALVRGWVSRFGVPAQITSDREPQFASAVWAAFCKQMGIKHMMTTAYHPQSNGMVERFHRQLKEALRARNCGADWADHLPWVLLGIRAARKDDTGVSLAELVYGYGLVLPGELQVPSPPVRDGHWPPRVRHRRMTRDWAASGGNGTPVSSASRHPWNRPSSCMSGGGIAVNPCLPSTAGLTR